MKYVSFQRVKNELLKARTSAHMTALSFAVGIGVAFSPLPGLHILIGFLLIKILRLNAVVSVLGILVHNPWTMIFIHLSGLVVGDLITSGSLHSFRAFDAFPWNELSLGTIFDGAFWAANGPVLKIFLWPFFVGSLVLSGAVGTGSYFLCKRFLRNQFKDETLDPNLT